MPTTSNVMCLFGILMLCVWVTCAAELIHNALLWIDYRSRDSSRLGI